MIDDMDKAPENLNQPFDTEPGIDFMKNIFGGNLYDQIDEFDMDHLVYAADVLAETYLGFDQSNKSLEQVIENAAIIWRRMRGFNTYQIIERFNMSSMPAGNSTLKRIARTFKVYLTRSELNQLFDNLVEGPIDNSVDSPSSAGALAVYQSIDYKNYQASTRETPKSKSNKAKSSLEYNNDSKVSADENLLRLYLDEIGKVPLLTKQDEVSLAQAIEAGKAAQSRLEVEEGLTKVDRQECQELISEGLRAHRKFVESNLLLVVSIAKKYNSKGLPPLDLIQEGNLGLIRAVDKFDWQKGFKFSTYATWWIRQFIRRGIAESARTIRMPVHALESLGTIAMATNDLAVEMGRKPTISEIALRVGLKEQKVEELMALPDDTISLNKYIFEGEGLEMSEIIEDPVSSEAFDNKLGEYAMGKMTDFLMTILDDKERRILELRYGIDGGGVRTLEQVGEEFHVTRERIRQIQAKAEDKLRHPSNALNVRDILGKN